MSENFILTGEQWENVPSSRLRSRRKPQSLPYHSLQGLLPQLPELGYCELRRCLCFKIRLFLKPLIASKAIRSNSYAKIWVNVRAARYISGGTRSYSA